MEILQIVKIGGNVLDDQASLSLFLHDFANLDTRSILIHGGGKIATLMAARLGVEDRLVEGRRITSASTLEVVTMVYAGLINKNIIATLQAMGCNAIGLTGADAGVLAASKRPKGSVDFGFVGDISAESLDATRFSVFLDAGLSLVIAPLTHNNRGQLLNTNADTIASAIARCTSERYDVRLIYCFEKHGVTDQSGNVFKELRWEQYQILKEQGVISGGMIPKLDSAFDTLASSVKSVQIIHASDLIAVAGGELKGTLILK